MNEREVADSLMDAILLNDDTVIFADIFNEDFENVGKVHDWRNHVDESVIALWNHLPRSAKLVAYIHAADLADREEWD